MKKLFEKNKELFRYFFFGIVTTAISFIAWYATMELGVLIWHDESGEPTWWLDIAGSTVQWVVGVIVAFVTSKKWVFVDADKGVAVTCRQFVSFTGSRVLTYILETLANLGLIELFVFFEYKSFIIPLGFYNFDVTERIWAKVLTALVVVVLNYVISKLFVFRKPKKKVGKKANETAK